LLYTRVLRLLSFSHRADQLSVDGCSLEGSPLEREGRAVSRPAGGKVAADVQAAMALLDPAGPHLQRMLLSIRAVLEANQARP